MGREDCGSTSAARVIPLRHILIVGGRLSRWSVPLGSDGKLSGRSILFGSGGKSLGRNVLLVSVLRDRYGVGKGGSKYE